MSTSESVRVELADDVLVVTLARAHKKNALTTPMYAALARALERAGSEPKIKAVLLDAEGDDFCAGNDIADFAAFARSGQSLQSTEVWAFLRRLTALDKPLVAAVRGRAIGIGMTMLLHCDLVFVAENARLSAPFVDLALVPEAGSSVLLPALLGHARAFAVFALGQGLDAPSAVACGLATEMLATAEVSAHAHTAAAMLAAKPAEALQATKRLMRPSEKLTAVLEAEGRIVEQRLRSPEAQRVFSAFLGRSSTD